MPQISKIRIWEFTKDFLVINLNIGDFVTIRHINFYNRF